MGLLATGLALLRYFHHLAMKSIQSAVRPIMKEITPNGGSSMKDQVNQLHKKLSTMIEQLAVLARDVALVRQKIDDSESEKERDIKRLDQALKDVNMRVDNVVDRRS